MSKVTLAIYGSKDIDSRDYCVFTHSHNLCLMQDGVILKYIELERMTRRKYDNRLDLFLEELIDKHVLFLPAEFDFVLANDFLSSSFISKNGKIRFESTTQDKLSTDLIPGIFTTRDGLFGIKKQKAYCCPHELAHIFSSLPFYGEFKENSLLVSFDGASSLGNYSSFLYRNGKLELIEHNWSDLKNESKFFNDNALVFRILGLEHKDHTSVPGKLMGFSSWGKYDKDIENWLAENNYFHNYWLREEDILVSIKNNFGIEMENFDTHNVFFQNIAATFQAMFERAVLRKLEKLQSKYHCDYLYYSGGCALNIIANTKIIESNLFKEVFIPPCCSDSGLSIGAASFLEWEKGNRIKIQSPYLNNYGIEEDFSVPTESLIREIAELLLQNKIIGICNGAGECGPRSLGNRSLISLANSKELAQKISICVKKREWYRPVAPIMLKGVAEKISVQRPHKLSKFMLMNFNIKDEYRAVLKGVVHADGSARIQTLEKEGDNPFMFCLLKYLYEKHKVLALINTSFNVAGEPIVQTRKDAFLSAKRMNIDGLIYNNQLFKRDEL